MEHIITGQKGEAIAYDFLRKNGYKIIKINYKNKIGEIDIICKDKDELVFVEVKTRTSYRFGLPREAVTEWKQNKIHNVALVYLMKNNLTDSKFRFDVIEICGEKIEHLKRCF
ncbi:MAG: YraN family protein [Clostridia bacterium]|nr:YraN family protein [Clostridia bacterium]